MSSRKKSQKVFEDIKLNVKLKLASLWVVFTYLIFYLNYFHLYMPDSLKDISSGMVFAFGITQTFLLVGIVIVTIPAIMIFLSVSLPAKVNRYTNIIVAFAYIPTALFNLVGEAWMHMFFAAIVEVVLLSLVIWYSWKWPKQEA